MKIAISIETKDRRMKGGTNYLGQTLRNLNDAGIWQSEHLHALCVVSGGNLPDYLDTEVEPNLPDPGLVTFYKCPDKGCTRQQNGARAIRVGASYKDADYVIKLEDDLDFIGDFLGSVARWLSDFGHAAVPMFSLGNSFERVSQSKFQPGETFLGPGGSFPHVRSSFAEGTRILPHSIGGFWGAQALVWTQPFAEHLSNWLGGDPFLWDGKQEHRERGHDLLLQNWGKETGARAFAVAVPSFVQHIGRQSNLDQPEIGHVQPFFELPWPGRDWVYRGMNA